MKYIALSLVLMLATAASAQLNLKKKLEKKADQEIDNLLFKKKKKETDQAADSYEVPGGGSVSSTKTSGTNDDDDYEPQPVDFESLNAEDLVHFTVLINMLPEATNGYVRNAKPDGSIYKSANYNVSTGSKEYNRDGKSLQLTLFDYREAAVLYTAQAGQFYEYESTDGYVKAIEVAGYKGWASKDYDDDDLTVFVGIKERYIFTANMEDGEVDDFASIITDIPLDRLP